MKIVKTQYGVELIPESSYEQDALETLAGKSITAKFTDSWNQTGNLVIQYEPHPWDK